MSRPSSTPIRKRGLKKLHTSRINRFFRIVAMALLAAGLLVLADEPAHASYPGTNGKIAFVSDRDGVNDQIYTMNPDGSGLQKLTNATSIYTGSYNPSFSGDGTKITFDRSGEIWTMNADGSGQTQLTHNTVPDSDPAFSPDGKKIIFLTRRGADASVGMDNIWVMNADGTGQTRLTSGGAASPTYSPDGTKIAFVRGGELWVMNSDGTGETQYTTNDTDYKYAASAVNHPTFSPDGSTIEFAATGRNGCTCWDYFSIKVGEAMMPTNLGMAASSSDANLAFSPDGSRIALQSNRSGNQEIYTMNPDGSGQTDITNNSAKDQQPDWGPQIQQQSTATTLSASPLTITYGQGTTLSGKLLAADGNSYAAQKVTIQQKPAGASSFTTLKSLSTNPDGSFTLAVKPSKNTYYRAVFSGNSALGLESSSSTATQVKVKVSVTENLSASSITLGKSLTISGAVSPSQTGSVKLSIKRNGKLLATRSIALSNSKYSYTYKPPSTGTYSVVASYAGSTTNLGNSSPSKSFTVAR